MKLKSKKICKISKISQAVPTTILKCFFLKEIWKKTLLEAPSYDHIAPPLPIFLRRNAES